MLKLYFCYYIKRWPERHLSSSVEFILAYTSEINEILLCSKNFKLYLAKAPDLFYLCVNYFVFNFQQDSNSRYSALNVQHQMLKVSNLKLFFMNE